MIGEKSEIYRRFEKKLRYLPNWKIERTANALLWRYNRDLLKRPQATPIDDILEFYMRREYGITIDIRDLQSQFPGEGVLGYYDFNRREICLDQELFEDKTVVGRRRCSFTAAHEIGHYLIHGRVWEGGAVQQRLYEKGKQKEGLRILEYRSTIDVTQEKEMDHLERQANHFAACLLMPKEMVKQAMRGQGHLYPIVVSMGDIAGEGNELFEYSYELVKSTEIHDIFKVNVSAMAYRLIKLGLLVREKEIEEGMILKW